MKHTTKRRLGLGAAGAMAATGALTAATVQPAAAFDACDLSTKVNELKAWDNNNEYNVMVWKDSAYESADLKGVELVGSEKKKPCAEFTNDLDTYHWAVFKSGEFVRKGDGGYRNWAFYGVFDREGDNKVVFHEK